MSMARWKDDLGKFGELDGADQWLVLRAAAWLGIARLMLIVMPFRRLAERLASDNKSSLVDPDADFLKRTGYAVSVAASRVPWRADCFPQTIAARMILKNKGYPSTIHIGVERVGDNVLNGHAWLTCGETVVTGDYDLQRYTELHTLNG
jgi:hypothetical protein